MLSYLLSHHTRCSNSVVEEIRSNLHKYWFSVSTKTLLYDMANSLIVETEYKKYVFEFVIDFTKNLYPWFWQIDIQG